MGDNMDIIETRQKMLQRSDLFITDLSSVNDAVVKKLSMMRDGPFPGRREEKESCQTTNRRNARAIRLEVMQASHEYLSDRMHPEQEDVIKDMKGWRCHAIWDHSLSMACTSLGAFSQTRHMTLRIGKPNNGRTR